MADTDDSPHEYCGVFGIFCPGLDVARISVFGLMALQHRGQESAGMATSDGFRFYSEKGMGLVSQIFNDQSLSKLRGYMGIGHTRYSTTGASELTNVHPFILETFHGPIGVAHNGNLTQANTLRRSTLHRGVGLFSSTDSEVIAQMLCTPPPSGEPDGPDWIARIRAFMAEAEGAYSLTVMTRDAVFGVRDALGLRPLCIGELDYTPGTSPKPGLLVPEVSATGSGERCKGYVLASESCALLTIGARYLREVAPGEIVRFDRNGMSVFEGRAVRQQALCVFEYVYFARPDSKLEGQLVHKARDRLGRQLAREAPVVADMVMSVPDSGTPAAIGFAAESGIPYGEGLTKNRYIARTFIAPDQNTRRIGIRLKFNPLTEVLTGKRVVVIDDSIVRGNTMRQMVQMLREGGAKEVHLRISSPPVRHPCFMGIDMATRDQLVIYQHNDSIEAVREFIGADSLAYISHEGMMRAVAEGRPGAEVSTADPTQLGYCSACFTGNYPLPIEDW